MGETLTPLMDGPDVEGCDGGGEGSDLRLLLGVMGAPLATMHVSTTDPLPHLKIKDTPIVLLTILLTQDNSEVILGCVWEGNNILDRQSQGQTFWDDSLSTKF
ncbi:hypothetical protein MRB53_034833 [Persea americana]|uniref:Uncharacterized protein n=1 Tax=Persea americana TaxID=3435 RepID=A0ACC2K2X0_PERAE|nr:hypothetical protein MRB53_034833 [Persea americana]